MDLVLAVDLQNGIVVHGKAGERSSYRPLNWGLSPVADPADYIRHLGPRFIYIADLDRIEGTGSNDTDIVECSSMVERCYLDRGCRNPGEFLKHPRITNIAATETTRTPLSEYQGGFFSLDLKGERVIPTGEDPVALLETARGWNFEGGIILNVGSVGTECGINPGCLSAMREAYDRPLFYGGGVAGMSDLDRLAALGFDGAIVATAVHRGAIPLEHMRRGVWC